MTINDQIEPEGDPGPARGSHWLNPVRLGPVAALLLLSGVYHAASSALTASVFLLLPVVGLLLLFRAPRWATYALLGITLLAYLWPLIFVVSVGPVDATSDRDLQLEIATRGFLAGQNPWSVESEIVTAAGDVAISMGPSSVLVAAPFMALFDRINELTLVFYILLFGFLLYGDFLRRNESFVLIGLLYLAGPDPIGFRHTLIYSLDELHFGYLALGLAWVALTRNMPLACGVGLAYAFLTRSSYAFPIFGFLAWYFFSRRYSHAELLRIGAGAGLGMVLIVGPIFLVGGTDLLRDNPWGYAGTLLSKDWPETNLPFRIGNAVAGWVGPGAFKALKVGGALAVLAFAAHRLAPRRLEHPFWHLALAGLVASLLFYREHLVYDYLPFCGFPALMAIAFSRRLV